MPTTPRTLGGLFQAAVLALACTVAAAEGDKLDPRGIEFFESKIRPVLAQKCHECHAADAKKVKGGLLVDTRDDLRKGGDTGPAIVPGKPESSLLIKAISYSDPDLQMPPKDRLPESVVKDFETWIRMGAPDPRVPGSGNVASDAMQKRARELWSLKPVAAVSIPTVKNASWSRTGMDRFILSRLESEKLLPSPEADRRTLIRRATFDLTGLPPTPGEVNDFLTDRRSGAYERVVDRLLAAPQFGERLASLWLNVARYAEDQAHQVGSDDKNFYPNAFRYREWVITAFNRDLPYNRFVQLQLAADQIEGADSHNLAALGFIGLGPKYYNRNKPEVMADEWEDRVDTVSRSFLGLTVACARCHEHKFDPISMEDYYGMAGVFASIRLVNLLPGGKKDEPAKNESVGLTALHVVEDGTVQDLNVLLRGNVERKGAVAPRRFIRALCPGEPETFKKGSGREELAGAISDPSNPLTARVMANRIWGLVFGTPLVVTPSNFGAMGEQPSHPELLDYIAHKFIHGGWSIKGLVREMALSATYRQSSADQAAGHAADPSNRLYWRMSRHRLTAEEWRDSLLAVSGELEPVGGKSLELDDPKNHRRTVYARISRLKLNDYLMQFDYPDANVHADKRSVTTTAIQKLFILNNPFVLREAKSLAARLTADPKEKNEQRVARAYVLLYGRPPERGETQLALEFLGKPETPEMPRWEQYAQMLLASNEMLYVD
jgi:hypothetical protein